MSRWEKNLAKMRRNPRDWRIDDLEIIANKLGMMVHKGSGSHVVFRHVDATMALCVPAHRPIKAIYIQQFLLMVDELTGGNDE
ncbi:MAG: type II toxin-antitoxin system HicA family toxin [Proteobacteria bacterium]|nr:type II toxin-antitoxin system HicA family toxin [Pseudomonadota bacterium]